MMSFVSWYTGSVRTQWPLGRMYLETVNLLAEMQGCNALKKFVRKGYMSFSRISHSRCLSGSVV